MSFIEHSLPLGDRDDAPEPQTAVGRPNTGSASVVERKPLQVPGVDLHLPRLEQALHDANMAFADLQAARARNDWPLFASAAARLARHGDGLRAITSHVGKAVEAARPRETCQPTEE